MRSRSTTAGLATGVAYIDKNTGRENHVRARIVVLAASACESARHPAQLEVVEVPAGPGELERQRRQVPDRHDRPRRQRVHPEADERHAAHNEDGVGGMHLFMPWWLDNKKLDFPRGYHIEPAAAAACRASASWAATSSGAAASGRRARRPGGYGKVAQGRLPPLLRRDGRLRRPRRDDPERGQLLRDRSDGRGQVGHPGAALPLQVDATTRSTRPSTCRRPSARSSRRWAARRSRDADARRGYGLAPGGRIIHELGVTRMGNDPSTSVLNKNCQAHDVKNLFVADGGPFVSQPTRTARGRSSRCRCARASSSRRAERPGEV